MRFARGLSMGAAAIAAVAVAACSGKEPMQPTMAPTPTVKVMPTEASTGQQTSEVLQTPEPTPLPAREALEQIVNNNEVRLDAFNLHSSEDYGKLTWEQVAFMRYSYQPKKSDTLVLEVTHLSKRTADLTDLSDAQLRQAFLSSRDDYHAFVSLFDPGSKERAAIESARGKVVREFNSDSMGEVYAALNPEMQKAVISALRATSNDIWDKDTASFQGAIRDNLKLAIVNKPFLGYFRQNDSFDYTLIASTYKGRQIFTADNKGELLTVSVEWDKGTIPIAELKPGIAELARKDFVHYLNLLNGSNPAPKLNAQDRMAWIKRAIGETGDAGATGAIYGNGKAKLVGTAPNGKIELTIPSESPLKEPKEPEGCLMSVNDEGFKIHDASCNGERLAIQWLDNRFSSNLFPPEIQHALERGYAAALGKVELK